MPHQISGLSTFFKVDLKKVESLQGMIEVDPNFQLHLGLDPKKLNPFFDVLDPTRNRAAPQGLDLKKPEFRVKMARLTQKSGQNSPH